jgi:pimeloyl-ACP methyl ester carboxylesterase
MWRPQLEAPPQGWRLIAPDLRGFGPSAGDAAATMDDMASDVAAFLDALEIDRATIGGLSMGGYVTFALFRLAPERFNGVVLADTRAQADTPQGREGRRKMLDLLRERGPSGIADDMLPKLLGETSKRERPRLQAVVREMIEANSAEGIRGAIEAMMGRPDSTPQLERMTCPTLVLVGDEDTLTPPADAGALDLQLSRSHLVTLPRAGHLSNLEAPDDFTRALSDFLTSNF